jgi:hypothetical protein
MASRSLKLSASLIVVCASISSCTAEAPNPVGVQTVRLALIAGSEHGGKPFSVSMTQEVTTTPVWNGDPDGTGTALITVNLGEQQVCWDVSVTAVTLPATFAHIHKAAPGIRGGIVVGLVAPDANGEASGCTSGVDREVLKEILTDPAGHYVNVHTTDFPAGAIRAQLAR